MPVPGAVPLPGAPVPGGAEPPGEPFPLPVELGAVPLPVELGPVLPLFMDPLFSPIGTSPVAAPVLSPPPPVLGSFAGRSLPHATSAKPNIEHVIIERTRNIRFSSPAPKKQGPLDDVAGGTPSSRLNLRTSFAPVAKDKAPRGWHLGCTVASK